MPAITVFLTNNNPIKPKPKAAIEPRIILGLKETFVISKIPAPKVTGRLIKKEYFTASSLFIFIKSAANIVEPLLDNPGNMATACMIPITRASR